MDAIVGSVSPRQNGAKGCLDHTMGIEKSIKITNRYEIGLDKRDLLCYN
jgi:hypothetical protein